MHTSKNIPSKSKILIKFTIIMIVLLLSIELFVRINQIAFEGASHRMLAKLAIYQRKPNITYLFFGTSRTQDGIAPGLITKHLRDISLNSNSQIGFNAAVMGESLDDLIELAPRYAKNSSLQTVFIELSTPHFANKPSLPTPTKIAEQSIEDKLSSKIQNIAFIKYRTAFRPGNLGSIISIMLFSPIMSGSETRLTDYISAWKGNEEIDPIGFDPKIWRPQLTVPSNYNLDHELKLTEIKLITLSKIFSEQGAKVIFFVPPASQENLPERTSLNLFYSDLAQLTKNQIWNFVDAPIPDSFFKDSTHLNKKLGQPSWSFAIAEQLKILKVN